MPIEAEPPEAAPPAGQVLIYQDGATHLQVRLEGRTVWLSQRLIAELFQVSVKTANEHLVNIYSERELDPEATIRSFRIVQTEGTAFPSMPQPVFDALPTRFVSSDIGPVPESWDVLRLDGLLTLQRGFDLPKQSRSVGSHPVFAASGLNGLHSEWKVNGPGVTTGRSGVLGQVFFVDRDFWPLNTSLWVKEYKRSNPWHAYFLLQTLDLAQFNAGSAVPTLNRNHVHSLPIVAPPESLLHAFKRICSLTFSLDQQIRDESDKLAAMRDYLLPKLLSGEVQVRDAVCMIDAAA